MQQYYRLYYVLVFMCFASLSKAQDIDYVRTVVRDLCSPEMAGRGYINNGDKKAAEYIREELKKAKLKSFTPQYFQPLAFQVNVFPGEVSFIVDNQALVPGEHFLVNAGCPPFSGTFNLIWVDSAMIDNTSSYQILEKKFLRNTFLVLNQLKGKKLLHEERLVQLEKNMLKAKGLIYPAEKKLLWGVSTDWDPFVIIHVKEGLLKPHQTSARITVESQLKGHNTQNVLGYIEGSKYKDSFVVFTAHYDHLGMMGKEAVFPGANDNASGVAMLLDLVKYYSKNKPQYNVAFIFFAGEEAGLIGSYYYTEKPEFPLSKIALLLNLDLMGTGDKGLTAVNATVFPSEFEDLQLTNNMGEYLPVIQSRGKAQNSDHYYFTEKGVKAFFFYLMGDYHFYHDVDDRYEVLPLSKYNEAFKLISDFTNDYMTRK